MSQLGLGPSVDGEGRIWGCDAIRIWSGAREDGLRRRQAAIPALQVRGRGLNWGRRGMRGDEAHRIGPVLIRYEGVRG